MPLRHAHMALSASLSHPSLRATGSKTSTRRRATLSPAPRPRALSRGRARCTRWPRRTTRALSSRASTPSKRRDLSILRDSRRPVPLFSDFLSPYQVITPPAGTEVRGLKPQGRTRLAPPRVRCHLSRRLTAISAFIMNNHILSHMRFLSAYRKNDDDPTQLPDKTPPEKPCPCPQSLRFAPRPVAEGISPHRGRPHRPLLGSSTSLYEL